MLIVVVADPHCPAMAPHDAPTALQMPSAAQYEGVDPPHLSLLQLAFVVLRPTPLHDQVWLELVLVTAVDDPYVQRLLVGTAEL